MMQSLNDIETRLGQGPLRLRRGKNDVFWSEYLSGAWEPDTRLVFTKYIDAQHSYIDVGAWIGPTLLLGAPLAKRAYGVEPDPIAFAELVENIEGNRPLTHNVELFNVCIAAESGEKSFGNRGDGGDSMSSLLFSSERTSWTVAGVNFQEWIEQNGIEDCNFIKIDIEGGEYSVLPTMESYLRRSYPTLLLSLHPCFLGDQTPRGIVARVRRSFYRLSNTISVLKVVSGYRYIYDPRGWAASGIDTLQSRVRDGLAKIRWKPAVMLLTCLYSMAGGNDALLITNRRW